MPTKIDKDDLRRAGAIIKLRNKEYTTHAGLLMVAHDNGLESLHVEMVSYDPTTREAVMKATVSGERGTYTDYGDASPKNVGTMIADACIRMASTRASSRALRFYLGVGMTCREELPGGREDEDDNEKPAQEEPVKEEVLVLPVQTKKPDPSWEKGRNGYFAALKSPDIDLQHDFVAWMCEKMNLPRPKHMPEERRKNLLAWLRNEEQKPRITAFYTEYSS